MNSPRHWRLAARLALVGLPFLLLGLAGIGATLWVSWQLDGGAAAVNEAGRLRMQINRMALAVAAREPATVPALRREFEATLATLRNGDPERPLFMPWDDTTHERYADVERAWERYAARLSDTPVAEPRGLREDTAAITLAVDALVGGIERHLSRWTAGMHLMQTAIMIFAVLGSAVMLYAGYLFVLEPVHRLKEATERIQRGDFDARVEGVASVEFESLAECFNGMAANLQSMYRDLEARVAEKTLELEEKRERLEALYDVTALVARATTLKELADGFVERVARVARADAVALRWADQAQHRSILLAARGLPEAMLAWQPAAPAGAGADGAAVGTHPVRVVALREQVDASALQGVRAGFATLVSVPVRLHERVMGEVDLWFHARLAFSPAERSLLETLAAHLAGAMENLRVLALEREAGIAQERGFIARELHDSIAQSLAFLRMQVELMRAALARGDADEARRVLEEIDAGVRESYGDVRELLMHFRTRANEEDIEPALRSTLQKFGHQAGVPATLAIDGHGLPLSPDVQIQVLHIVQEALSNVRKHAQAGQVVVEVQRHPRWRFEIRDDGIGFDEAGDVPDETHVGLRIMAERAERIGARLAVTSAPGCGTTVVLTLPSGLVAAGPALVGGDAPTLATPQVAGRNQDPLPGAVTAGAAERLLAAGGARR